MLKPGDKLRNGATVVAVKPGVVLAVWKDSEYVTWALNDENDTCWGHYFQDFLSAVNDFNNRY